MPLTVTRYHGERWEQVGSDLLCGIADVFQDVGIIVPGKSTDVASQTLSQAPAEVRQRWVPIDSASRLHKSVYSFSIKEGWLFVLSLS